MSELDDFIAEIHAYNMNWFGEIGGYQARAELEALRAELETTKTDLRDSTAQMELDDMVINSLLSDNTKLRELLKKIEWIEDGRGGHYCPRCGGDEREGHYPNCPLATALKETETR